MMAQVRVPAFLVISVFSSLNRAKLPCGGYAVPEIQGENRTRPFEGPVCCNSGYATKNIRTGCARWENICAKAEGEKCGGAGASMEHGPCATASGLFCKEKECGGNGLICYGICTNKSTQTPNKNEITKHGNDREWQMIKTKKCTSPTEEKQCLCEGGRDSCVKPSKADLENPKLPSKVRKEGWCWIVNLHDSQYRSAKAFCYEDLKFNWYHGRYYSYDACDPLKKPENKDHWDGDGYNYDDDDDYFNDDLIKRSPETSADYYETETDEANSARRPKKRPDPTVRTRWSKGVSSWRKGLSGRKEQTKNRQKILAEDGYGAYNSKLDEDY